MLKTIVEISAGFIFEAFEIFSLLIASNSIFAFLPFLSPSISSFEFWLKPLVVSSPARSAATRWWMNILENYNTFEWHRWRTYHICLHTWSLSISSMAFLVCCNSQSSIASSFLLILSKHLHQILLSQCLLPHTNRSTTSSERFENFILYSHLCISSACLVFLRASLLASCFFLLTSSENSSRCFSLLINLLRSLLPNLEAPYMQVRRVWPWKTGLSSLTEGNVML